MAFSFFAPTPIATAIRRTSKGIAVLFLASMAGVFIYAVFGGFRPGPPPSDQQMIENFERNRATFEALREKICAHDDRQAVMMDPSWSRPEVSDDIREEYYALLRRVSARGIQSVKTQAGDCAGSVEYWSVGFLSGDYKKYNFGPPWKDSVLVDSLDNLPLSQKIQFFHRDLTDGWALAFNHWP
ncbi:MAG TPA: hypothetical protein VFS04_02175 [Alphaproteobacteria bacterium]|nr:hypothetical protein [Alphaproteobacteria bacterium]